MADSLEPAAFTSAGFEPAAAFEDSSANAADEKKTATDNGTANTEIVNKKNTVRSRVPIYFLQNIKRKLFLIMRHPTGKNKLKPTHPCPACPGNPQAYEHSRRDAELITPHNRIS
jgi:hypothetical protein